MNKKVVFVLASLLTFGACTKEDARIAEELHEITFNVSTLNAAYEPISRAVITEPDLTDILSSIDYIVFRNGVYFSQGTQVSSVSSFGNLAVKVPSGDCTVYLAGFGKEGKGGAYFGKYNTLYGIWSEQREVYYSSVEGVNIANAKTYSAELPRKTGAITLNIMDSANAPSNFAGLRLNLTYPEFWGITVNAGYQSGSKSITFPGTASSFPEVFINTWPFAEQQITLEVLTIGNNVLKTIKVNAPVYENKKTVITGELFGGSQSFTVSINDSWGEDNIVNFE